jgi:hypothetical protein
MYVIRDDETLVELAERPYDSEDLLQGLLARYPNLLAGEQMDSGNPRRWLLVAREAGLPAEDGGAARWSVDHLFVDQDGIPTLVEVKRSSDTRIRREVVGQMLDYAASAVVYWPVEALRTTFEASCTAQALDSAQVLVDALGIDDPDVLWATVKTNLQAGKVRLIFVADVIPPELQRIVEFLNGQMDPAEVLAIEIRQYVGEGLRTLVPRLIGQTAAAAEKKQTASRQATRAFTEESFFAALAARLPPEQVEVARRIYVWMQVNATHGLWWGRGKVDGSVYPVLHDLYGKPHWLVALWTTGHVTLQFGFLAADPAFAPEERRLELLRRLNNIPGVDISPSRIALFPSIRLAQLIPSAALDQFIAILDWAMQTIKAAWPQV